MLDVTASYSLSSIRVPEEIKQFNVEIIIKIKLLTYLKQVDCNQHMLQT